MKSYAAVYPFDGRMLILYDYDGVKKEVIDYTVPKINDTLEFVKIYELFSNVKDKFDGSPETICICIPLSFVEYKDTFINSARNAGLKNVETAEISVTESLEVIAQSGYNLKNDKIIWTCLKLDCWIWKGKFCVKNTYKTLKDLFIYANDEAMETTEYAPDVFVYEKVNVKNIEAHFIKDLFPDSVIIEYEKQDLRNAALTYAQFMPYEKKYLNSKNNKTVYFGKRNERLPLTYIHVAVNVVSRYVQAVYHYNGKQKDFQFRLRNAAKLNCLASWSELKNKLKIAEARINGKFGYLCIFKPSTNSYVNAAQFKIEWAEDIKFEKVEVINEKNAEYAAIVSQLPVKIKSTDILWILKGSIGVYRHKLQKIYDIWEGHIYQESIEHSELKQKQKTLKQNPNFVVYNRNDFKETVRNELKAYFPDSLIYSYIDNVSCYNIPIEYTKMIAETYFPGLLLHNKESISKVDENADLNNIEPNSTEKVESASFGSEHDLSDDQLSNKNELIYKFDNLLSVNNDEIKVIGIDLGTSRCCAAVNRKNGITTVHLDNKGERLLPSYVAYDEANPIFGQVVINRLRQFSRSTVFDSKRIIGRNLNDIEIDSNWPFRISENSNNVVIEIKRCNVSVQISAEDVAADLLRYMKQKSEEYQGTKLDTVIITVPAAFTEAQKNATIRAARLADFNNVHLLPEPIAAAFAYFTNKSIPENENILVFDLGGGTLDVCSFIILNNQIQIISNTGDTKLGGRDFDTVLFNNFRNQLDVKHGISLNRDKKYKLITESQQIKEDLSTVSCRHLNIDDYDASKDGIIAINRSDFENMTKPLLNKVKNTINSAMHNAKQNPKDINKILLVGGGSRMPMIKTLLKEIFPLAEQCVHENPDEVVAIGAAYYAYSIYSQ